MTSKQAAETQMSGTALFPGTIARIAFRAFALTNRGAFVSARLNDVVLTASQSIHRLSHCRRCGRRQHALPG